MATKKPKGRAARKSKLSIEAEVLIEDSERGTANYQIVTHEKPITIRAQVGHALLFYTYGDGEDAMIAAIFDPHGLGESMVERCAKMLEEVLADSKAGVTAAAQADLARHLARATTRAFIHHLQPKFSHALAEHENETLIFTRGLLEHAFREAGVTNFAEIAAREIERHASAVRSERRTFLTGSIKRIAGKPDFAGLGEEYTRLRPIWKKAQEVYKASKKFSAWPEMVRAQVGREFQGADLPPDLLSRLPDAAADLPEELQSAITRTNAENSPSHIAIEHAARLCGAGHYAKRVSAYFRMIEGGGKVIKTKGVN